MTSAMIAGSATRFGVASDRHGSSLVADWAVSDRLLLLPSRMPEEKCESGEQRPIRMPGLRGSQKRGDPSAMLLLVLRRGSAMRLRKVDRSGRDRYRTDTSIARLTGEHTCGANTPLGAPEGQQLVSG